MSLLYAVMTVICREKQIIIMKDIMMHVNVKYTGGYIVILQCLANTKALFKLQFVQRALTTHFNLLTETIHICMHLFRLC